MSTLGIDLGTTNTVAAVRFEVVPLALEDGEPILPSVVAYPPSGVTLVGSRARRRRAIDPKNTIYSSKRFIGRRWGSAEAEELARRYPFDLIEGADGGIAFKTRGGYLDATDIAATILQTVHREATAEIARAVVSVPSRFGREQREATVEAVHRAGFGEVSLIDEPVATATAYLAGGIPPVQYAVVYDLGGGTFDMALVNCRHRPFRVLAHGGDLFLGGDDIDRAIAGWAADEVSRRHRWDLRDDPLVFDRLIAASERAKIELANEGAGRIEMSSVDPAAPAAAEHLSLDAPLLESLALDLVYRSFVICDAVLADAGVRADQVEEIFLAGGTTRLPMVSGAVARYFGRTPRADHDPMVVVALGASLAGGDAW